MKMRVLPWNRTRNTGHCGHITEGKRKFLQVEQPQGTLNRLVCTL